MSPRASFLVWWGLPILCVGLGAGIAAFLGEGGMFGRGPGQIGPLMVGAGYFAAVAALALIFRIRQSQVAFRDRDRFDKPVELAMVALCAPILAAGVWVATKSAVGNLAPVRTISGKLESVDQIGAFGRTYAIDLDTTATPLMLECRFKRNCGSPTPFLQLQPGTQIQTQLLQGKVLGLWADGRTLVEPRRQRAGRLALGAAILVALIAYALSFAVVSVRLLFGPQDTERRLA
ncbi:hypothetical protein [Phenylobacterium sp.]